MTFLYNTATNLDQLVRCVGFGVLEGHTLVDLQLKDGGYSLVIETEDHILEYHAEGVCCAHAYVQPLDEDALDGVLGHTIIATQERECEDITPEGHWGALDAYFYSIQTTHGDVDLEMRVDHNGYYGGALRLVRVTKKGVA